MTFFFESLSPLFELNRWGSKQGRSNRSLDNRSFFAQRSSKQAWSKVRGLSSSDAVKPSWLYPNNKVKPPLACWSYHRGPGGSLCQFPFRPFLSQICLEHSWAGLLFPFTTKKKKKKKNRKKKHFSENWPGSFQPFSTSCLKKPLILSSNALLILASWCTNLVIWSQSASNSTKTEAKHRLFLFYTY